MYDVWSWEGIIALFVVVVALPFLYSLIACFTVAAFTKWVSKTTGLFIGAMFGMAAPFAGVGAIIFTEDHLNHSWDDGSRLFVLILGCSIPVAMAIAIMGVVGWLRKSNATFWS